MSDDIETYDHVPLSKYAEKFVRKDAHDAEITQLRQKLAEWKTTLRAPGTTIITEGQHFGKPYAPIQGKGEAPVNPLEVRVAALEAWTKRVWE